MVSKDLIFNQTACIYTYCYCTSIRIHNWLNYLYLTCVFHSGYVSLISIHQSFKMETMFNSTSKVQLGTSILRYTHMFNIDKLFYEHLQISLPCCLRHHNLCTNNVLLKHYLLWKKCVLSLNI